MINTLSAASMDGWESSEKGLEADYADIKLGRGTISV